ncbi:restriction endonuclease subunit S [Clostridium perfringens]|uniref:restriction endonuclease subunit S n=1 Tax=Clostridium perfringens TaxID=1502 RepID=UPI0024BC9F36|nr:restriction endonuclease subunit S [Clostridium perfringens]MDM0463281.1 restriction endonuclease subunit S [Clostridium perfringens]
MDKKFKKLKIKELAEVVTGGTPSTKKKEYWENGNIPWLPSGACKDKVINVADSFITSLGLENSSAKMMPKGTVVIALTGATTGKLGILGFEACANQSVTGIIPNDKFNNKYIFYYLKSIREKILFDSYGGAQKHISQGYVKDIDIVLPDIKIQHNIVYILEKSQKLIDKRKEQIGKLDLLVKSKFIEMFGDPVKNQKKLAKVKLSELGEWKTGGTPLRSKSEYYNGNIPWLSSGELNNKYCFKSNEMITESAIIESAAKIIEVGSLLLGMYDTAALKSTINMIECSCNQAIAYSKLNENLVNTVYVYYCIQIGKEFYKSQQRGVRQKNLNLSMIKGLEILMPELELQNQFAEFVKRVDKLKFEMEKSLKELEDNFNSLMQKAFKGELFK